MESSSRVCIVIADLCFVDLQLEVSGESDVQSTLSWHACDVLEGDDSVKASLTRRTELSISMVLLEVRIR